MSGNGFGSDTGAPSAGTWSALSSRVRGLATHQDCRHTDISPVKAAWTPGLPRVALHHAEARDARCVRLIPLSSPGTQIRLSDSGIDPTTMVQGMNPTETDLLVRAEGAYEA